MHVSPPRSMPPPVYAGAFSPAGNQHHQGEPAAVSAAKEVSKALHIHTLLVFEPVASAPPFATYTRPQQPAFAVEQRLEEEELSAALVASLKDYHHHQHQQQRHHTQLLQQQQQQQAAVVPRASARVVEIESVNAVAQVLLGVIFI